MTRTVFLVISVVLTLAALAGSLYVYGFKYDQLPERIAVHWDIHGQPDNYVGKENVLPALLAMPAGMAALVVLTLLFPWLSPRRFEVEPFVRTYHFIMALVVVLAAYLHAVIVWGGIQQSFPVIRWLLGGLFLFFLLLGNRLGQVRRNFWMGVRTPWTLASDAVWVRTHRLAAWLFVILGAVGLVAVLLGVPPVALFVAVMGTALVPVVYSLVLYKRLERQGKI